MPFAHALKCASASGDSGTSRAPVLPCTCRMPSCGSKSPHVAVASSPGRIGNSASAIRNGLDLACVRDQLADVIAIEFQRAPAFAVGEFQRFQFLTPSMIRRDHAARRARFNAPFTAAMFLLQSCLLRPRAKVRVFQAAMCRAVSFCMSTVPSGSPLIRRRKRPVASAALAFPVLLAQELDVLLARIPDGCRLGQSAHIEVPKQRFGRTLRSIEAFLLRQIVVVSERLQTGSRRSSSCFPLWAVSPGPNVSQTTRPACRPCSRDSRDIGPRRDDRRRADLCGASASSGHRLDETHAHVQFLFVSPEKREH